MWSSQISSRQQWELGEKFKFQIAKGAIRTMANVAPGLRRANCELVKTNVFHNHRQRWISLKTNTLWVSDKRTSWWVKLFLAKWSSCYLRANFWSRQAGRHTFVQYACLFQHVLKHRLNMFSCFQYQHAATICITNLNSWMHMNATVSWKEWV